MGLRHKGSSRILLSVLRNRSLRCGFLIALSSALMCGQGVISTVAGNGTATAGGDGGPATSASFHPDGLALDSAGNIYIADQNNNRIRKVDLAGNISTVAGNGNTQFNGDGGPGPALRCTSRAITTASPWMLPVTSTLPMMAITAFAK